MADKSSTGAVHLTTLDLDVSKVFEQLNEISQKVQETAEQVRNTPLTFGENTKKNVGQTFSQVFQQATKSAQEFNNTVLTSVKKFENLNLQYKSFQNTLSRSNLKAGYGKQVEELKGKTNEFAKQVEELTKTVQENGTVTQEQASAYDTLKSNLTGLKGEFKDIDTAARNAGIGISEFLNRLADKAKWMLAFQLVSLVQNALNNVISTIKETEDTIVELKRVLDENISNQTISDELYNIAYEFGQSFENVSEVAIRFAQTGKTWQEVIDATRATMLGLNTAELEVTTATEGLIAVMAQFQIPASELESVIDRVNITADNFPVTSEKIVSALQRAGGTASAFNMTLEETIATITALAEKTGRSGENIGTALNSLIIFTSKSDNLKLFSSLSDQIEEAVKDFQAGSGSIIDVWKQLGKEIETLSKEQQDALFDSTAFEEFADQFEAEAAEYAGSIQKIYGTAGAYRRNYLTVLLQDIDQVDKVLEEMAKSEGYSLAENATAMERLSAQWNQLVISAKELAVQFGDAGFLDFLKFLTQATTASLRLLKEIGGLNTVLILLSVALLKVKVGANGLDKIPVWFDEMRSKGVAAFKAITSPITGAISAIKLFVNEMKAGKTATEAFKSTIATFDVGSLVTGLGSVLLIVNLVVQKWNEYKQAQREAMEETISAGKQAAEESEAVYELYTRYLKAKETYDTVGGSARELTETSNSLVAKLKEQGIEVKNLTGDYDELTEALKNYTLIDLEKQQVKQTEAVRDAEKLLEDAAAEINAKLAKSMGVSIPVFSGDATKILEEYKYQLSRQQQIIEEFQKEGKSIKEAVSSKQYLAIENTISSLDKYVDSLNEANDELEKTEQRIEALKNGTVDLTDTVNNATASISGPTQEQLEHLDELIESLGNQFDKLSSKVDSFQSAYSSIVDIIDEYNKTGELTADQLQTLLGLEPEYLALIDEKNGKLSINQEKLQELIQANNDYMIQMAAIKMAEEAESLVKKVLASNTANLTAEEIKAKLATELFTDEITNASYAMLKGEDDGTRFKNALVSIANQSGATAEQVKYLTGEVGNLTNAYMNLVGVQNSALSGVAGGFSGIASKMKNWVTNKTNPLYSFGNTSNFGIGNYYTPKKSSGGSSKSSGKSATEIALENEKKAIEEVIRVRKDEIYFMEKNGASAEELAAKYKELQDEVHKQADKYRAMGVAETDQLIKDLQKKWWEYQESIEKLISGIYEANVDAYQNAIDQLEFEYDKLSDMMDYSGMTDNLKKQIEEQKKIQEAASNEYERLTAKGIDLNDDAVQSVLKTWRSATNSIEDLNEKIADNIIERYDEFISLADSFNVWDKLDVSKIDYLKQEMTEINKLFNDGSISVSKYKDLLESLGKAYLEAGIEELENQQNKIKEDTDKLIDSYNKQIDRIKEQKNASDKYYDDLIDNLKETEEYNDRINSQLDYYADRQKILRNLEQAQSRSGVDWREKEIQYQEELANLDENWRRTQQEWNISDQIDALEKLKQEAAERFDESIARIEEYIKAAEKESEDAIKAISAQMEDLREKVYKAITAELERATKASGDLKNSLTGIGDTAKPSIDSLGKYIESTLKGSIKTVSDNIISQISSAGETASKSLANSFTNNFFTPISTQISSLMKEATSADSVAKASSQSISNSKKAPTLQEKVIAPTISGIVNASKESGRTTAGYTNNQTVNVFANIAQDTTSGAVNALTNKLQDFFTQPFKR